jgi:hypothetical protein
MWKALHLRRYSYKIYIYHGFIIYIGDPMMALTNESQRMTQENRLNAL